MASVTIEIPRVLRESAGGRARLELEADRLGAACARLRADWPVLATHVFTESGALRPHVLLLLNDRLTGGDPDAPLAAGDRLAIVQAVSGG